MLFTIDSAASLSGDEDDKLHKILDLAEYLDDGLMLYRDKREGCILAGIDHVI
jgi:hypothetical protein